jgi:D-xylulose reductase
VFECSGYAPAMAEMFDLLCPGGRVALVGIPLEPFPFDVSKAQIKEARIENVFRYAHVYPRAVALLASGKIDVKPLITDRYAFADSVEAFDFAKAMPPASVKVQIEMPA